MNSISIGGVDVSCKTLQLMADILMDDPIMDELVNDNENMESDEALILSLVRLEEEDSEEDNSDDSDQSSSMLSMTSPQTAAFSSPIVQMPTVSTSKQILPPPISRPVLPPPPPSKKKSSLKSSLLVSPLHMPLNDFKNNFRVSLSSFEKLLGLTRESPFQMTNERSGAYNKLTIETYWLVWLWYLGNAEGMKMVAKRFQLTESGAHMCIRQMAEWTRTKLCRDFIIWPYAERRAYNLRSFEANFGMPHVLGVLDTTLIPSHILKDCDRVTGRGSHALQAVVGPNLCFLDVYCVLSSGKSCVEILSDTRLYRETGALIEDSVILAGPQYPLLQWLITPFSDVDDILDKDEKRFNQVHEKIMGVSNTAFKIMFGTFRRLDNLDSLSSRERASVVSSCCALHNFLLVNNDCEFDTSQLSTEVYSFPLTPDPLVEDSSEGIRIRSNLLDIFRQIQPKA